jgi:hypothetical protein
MAARPRRKPEGARSVVRVSIWVKDGPGTGKLIADWMTDGRTEIDHHAIDYSRFYPIQKTEPFIYERCYETAQKIYTPPVHGASPMPEGRNLRVPPFYLRERRAGRPLHGDFRLGARARLRVQRAPAGEIRRPVPVRPNEWDNRHFWRVSNAEHLELSENIGMINLSHFAIYDVSGPGRMLLMEWLCPRPRSAATTPSARASTRTSSMTEGRPRGPDRVPHGGPLPVIDGADAGNARRDLSCAAWPRTRNDVTITDVTENYTASASGARMPARP